MSVSSPAIVERPRHGANALVAAGAVLAGALVVALYGEPLRATLGGWWQSAILPVFLDAQLGGLHICL